MSEFPNSIFFLQAVGTHVCHSHKTTVRTCLPTACVSEDVCACVGAQQLFPRPSCKPFTAHLVACFPLRMILSWGRPRFTATQSLQATLYHLILPSSLSDSFPTNIILQNYIGFLKLLVSVTKQNEEVS